MEITSEAQAMLAQIERPEGQVLRLEPTSSDRLGLVLGTAHEDDEVIERDGQDLLHLPAAVSAMLADAVVNRVDTPEGPRFAIEGGGRRRQDSNGS